MEDGRGRGGGGVKSEEGSGSGREGLVLRGREGRGREREGRIVSLHDFVIGIV